MTGGSISAAGAGTVVTVSGTTTISAASLYAGDGATLSLPNLTSFSSNQSTFQVDGTGSVLDVSALNNVTQQGPLWLEATHGGTLELSDLASLTSTQGVFITDTGGSTMQDGDLTDLDEVGVTIDGTDAQVATAWTTFTGSITLDSGTQTLPNLATASFSGLQLDAGSTLDLPVATASVTDTGDMAIGAGSTLSVAGTLTLTSGATLDEQIAGPPASGLIGQVDVGGSAVLAGTLKLDLVNGFTPSPGQDFSVLTYRGATGMFATFSGLTTDMTADQGATELDLDVTVPVISWSNPDGGDWDVATNWSTGVVPSASDAVDIDTVAAATITIQPNDDIQVETLTTGSNDAISITGGSLKVRGGDSILQRPIVDDRRITHRIRLRRLA